MYSQGRVVNSVFVLRVLGDRTATVQVAELSDSKEYRDLSGRSFPRHLASVHIIFNVVLLPFNVRDRDFSNTMYFTRAPSVRLYRI